MPQRQLAGSSQITPRSLQAISISVVPCKDHSAQLNPNALQNPSYPCIYTCTNLHAAYYTAETQPQALIAVEVLLPSLSYQKPEHTETEEQTGHVVSCQVVLVALLPEAAQHHPPWIGDCATAFSGVRSAEIRGLRWPRCHRTSAGSAIPVPTGEDNFLHMVVHLLSLVYIHGSHPFGEKILKCNAGSSSTLLYQGKIGNRLCSCGGDALRTLQMGVIYADSE